MSFLNKRDSLFTHIQIDAGEVHVYQMCCTIRLHVQYIMILIYNQFEAYQVFLHTSAVILRWLVSRHTRALF